MSVPTRWLRNTRPFRLGIGASLAFLLLLGISGLVAIPAIGAPPLITWLGLSLIGAIGILFLLHLQPMTIGVSATAVTVHWLLRHKTIPVASIEQYRFRIEQKYLNREWPRRYYSLHLQAAEGRRILVGGIDGPLARALLASAPPARVKVLVYSGNRLVEERGVEPSVGES